MKSFRADRSARGFSLVEVTIALGVAGFCLVAIVGLLQTGLSSERSTVEQTEATGILSSIFSDMEATPLTLSKSRIYQVDLTAGGTSPQTIYFASGGRATGAVNAAATSASRYRASVSLTPVNNGSSVQAIKARIVVTWPAVADPSPSTWPKNPSGVIETVTILRRN